MSGDLSSTLLPASRVGFYVTDAGTVSLAQKLTDDWRFARVEMNIVSSGIDSAIKDYRTTPSPELVILETDDVSDDFIAKLGSLSSVCAEGTDAVIIGPKNDVHLYRSFISMGVRDYLVRPLEEAELVDVIAKALVEKRGLVGAQLVAVVGGKGGVGTTTVAQLVAWSLAEKLEKKTLLIDAAGSNSTLGVSYGVEPSTSFSDAVRVGQEGSDDDMKRIVQNVTDNLSMLVCGGDPVLSARPNPDAIEALINRIMLKSPVVVMDLSGASRAVQQRMIALASEVVVVTVPLLSSLRNARTYLEEIKNVRHGMNDVDLVLNMHGMAGGNEVPLKDIEAALGIAPTIRIPYAPKIFAVSEASGKPVGQDKSASGIMSDIAKIASRAASIDGTEEQSGKAGFMSLFKSSGNKNK